MSKRHAPPRDTKQTQGSSLIMPGRPAIGSRLPEPKNVHREINPEVQSRPAPFIPRKPNP
jgi:hypothetical protein